MSLLVNKGFSFHIPVDPRSPVTKGPDSLENKEQQTSKTKVATSPSTTTAVRICNGFSIGNKKMHYLIYPIVASSFTGQTAIDSTCNRIAFDFGTYLRGSMDAVKDRSKKSTKDASVTDDQTGHKYCKQVFLTDPSNPSTICGIPLLVYKKVQKSLNRGDDKSKKRDKGSGETKIYVRESFKPMIDQMIQSYVNIYKSERRNAPTKNANVNIVVVGVKPGDKIPLQCVKTQTDTSSSYVQVFSMDNNVDDSKLSYSIIHEKKKMKASYASQFQAVARDRVKREEFLKENADECYEVTRQYEMSVCSTSPSYPLSSEAVKQNECLSSCSILFTNCPESIQEVLSYERLHESSNKEFISFAESLEHFNGDHICLYQVPDSLAEMGYCNIEVYLKPRIPKQHQHKLIIVPYRDREHSIECTSEEASYTKDIDKSYTDIEIEMFDEEKYELKEYVGFIGSRKEGKIAELKKKYPNGFELAYILPTSAYKELTGQATGDDKPNTTTDFTKEEQNRVIISRRSALRLYEDGYMQFFEQNPAVADWLVNTACDVYDTEPENVLSGYDYDKQSDTKPTHLQDISVRRSLRRLNREFEGKRLVQVRGFRSEAYVLNPGQVAFHRPEWICKPEYHLDFMIPGSIESFWQSNKVLLVKREQQ